MTKSLKGTLGGGLFATMGLLTCIYAWRDLQIGTALEMGPGYFPLVLGILLFGLGLCIVLTGMAEEGEIGPVPWRAVLLISLAPVVFALTVTGLGLVGASVLACLVSCKASADVPLAKRLMLAIGLPAFCVLLFSFGLGVSVPLIGSWLS